MSITRDELPLKPTNPNASPRNPKATHDLPEKLNKFNLMTAAIFLVQKIIPHLQKVGQKSLISKTSPSHLSFRQKTRSCCVSLTTSPAGLVAEFCLFESSNPSLPSSFLLPFAYKIVMRITRNERAPALESFVLFLFFA